MNEKLYGEKVPKLSLFIAQILNIIALGDKGSLVTQIGHPTFQC